MSEAMREPWDYWREPIENTFRIRQPIRNQAGEITNRRIIGVVVREDDARMIVAAPTMAEYIASCASNGCAEAWKIMEQIAPTVEVRNLARAAIAKAEGRQS